MSLGRINYQIYWIFYRTTESINDLRQLKGKRIALGPQGSGQRPMTEKILEASGVSSETTTLLGLSAQDAVNAINDGQIDALFSLCVGFANSAFAADKSSCPRYELY